MIGAFASFGVGLFRGSWAGGKVPGLLVSLWGFTTWRDKHEAQAKAEVLEDYYGRLTDLGITEDEMERIALNDWEERHLEVFLCDFDEAKLEEIAGANWRELFEDLFDMPMILLGRELFMLEKMGASFKERGWEEFTFPKYPFVMYGTRRLDDEWFLERAGVTKEQVERKFEKTT